MSLDTVLLQKTSLERNATDSQRKMVKFQSFFENVVHFETFNKLKMKNNMLLAIDKA